jgi:hypothetical protein
MKTTIQEGTAKPKTIKMGQMKPTQIGWVNYLHTGARLLVMRTANKNTFEVMDLTNLRPDSCWVNCKALDVELITGPVTITFDPT